MRSACDSNVESAKKDGCRMRAYALACGKKLAAMCDTRKATSTGSSCGSKDGIGGKTVNSSAEVSMIDFMNCSLFKLAMQPTDCRPGCHTVYFHFCRERFLDKSRNEEDLTFIVASSWFKLKSNKSALLFSLCTQTYCQTLLSF